MKRISSSESMGYNAGKRQGEGHYKGKRKLRKHKGTGKHSLSNVNLDSKMHG
jgi:hypothetical protein